MSERSTQNYSDLVYRSHDGRLDLYARDYAGRDDLPPLLMMHGLTRNSADFEPLIAKLDSDRRIIVPDQRGRGRSEYDDNPALYNPLIYAQDMFALLQAVGCESAVMVGTSMGGLIAMLMAAQKPDCLNALILNDVGPEVNPEGIARLQGYVGQPVTIESWDDAAAYCRKIGAIAFPEFDDAQWMEFARRTFDEDTGGKPVAAYDPAISQGVKGATPSAAPPDLWPVWQMLNGKPVLLIRGADSDILSAETANRMRATHGDLYQAVEIAGRGHAPMLDEDDAVAAIAQFLRALL